MHDGLRFLGRIGSQPLILSEILAIVLLVKSCETPAETGGGGSGTTTSTTADGGGGSGGETGGTGGTGGETTTVTGGAGGTGGATGGAGGVVVTGGTGGAGGSPCEVTTTCNGWTCGSFVDNCGGELVCGAECGAPQVCAGFCKCANAIGEESCGADTIAARCGENAASVPAGCKYLKWTAQGSLWCCPFGAVN